MSRDERESLFDAHVEMIMEEERERREGRRRELLQKEEVTHSDVRDDSCILMHVHWCLTIDSCVKEYA